MINDGKMPRKIKGKLYMTVIRPVMLYGAEMWTGTKSKTSRVEAAEMKMLRRIMKRSEDIRRELGVGDIKGKVREAKLRWAHDKSGRR